MPLQFRRGTDAERQAMTTPLAPGEPLFVTTPGLEKLYIGDGVAMNGIPVTGYTDQNSLDAVGNSLVDNNGSNQQITFSYNTLTGVITASVSVDTLYDNLDLNSNDITGVGNIDIQGQIRGTFKGSLFGDDSTPLVDGVASSVLLNGTIKDDIVPANGFTVDIGSTTNRFNDVYLKENARIFLDDVILRVDTGFVDISGGMSLGDSLIIDGAEIRSIGTAIDLPEGSTINGFPIESIAPGQNYNVNIVGNDSSIIVNSATGVITADLGIFQSLEIEILEGDVKGSVFGQGSQIIVNSLTGDVTAADLFVENELNADYISTREIYLSTTEDSLRAYVQRGDDLAVVGYNGTRIFKENVNPGEFPAAISIRSWNDQQDGNLSFIATITAQLTASADLQYTSPDSVMYFGVGNNTNDGAIVANIDSRGNFTAGALTTGVYTTTPTDDRPTGVKGMIIFNDTTGKFQGFDGSSWVDLS